MTTPKFAHVDTKKADGFYIQFEMQKLFDADASPDDYLFQDDEYKEQDQARLDAYEAGDWEFVGVRAVAKCLVVKNGMGTYMTLESPGLWGIESDSGDDYFSSVYDEQRSELLDIIASMHDPIVEN